MTDNELAQIGLPVTRSRSKRPPVSIILGFTLHDALVIASDSQASFSDSTAKNPDVKKVIGVTLKGRCILFARAGNLEAADVFEEEFRQQLEAADLTPPRAIADCAWAAMRETRRKVVLNMRQDGFSDEAVAQQMRENACVIILGYIVGNQPVLYSLRLESAYASRCTGSYIALGCAANVASVVLTGYDFPKMVPPAALGLAAYAIEMCKMHDAACCGKTQVGLMVGLNGNVLGFFDESKGQPLASVAQKTMAECQEYVRNLVAKNIQEAGIMVPHNPQPKASIDGPKETPPRTA